MSALPADAAVERGAADLQRSVALRPPVDPRPIGPGQEGAEQGVSGVLLVEAGAAPGAHGDRPVDVQVGRQRRLERPVVGQLHLGEDTGFHAVGDLVGSVEGHDCTSLRHVPALGGSFLFRQLWPLSSFFRIRTPPLTSTP